MHVFLGYPKQSCEVLELYVQHACEMSLSCLGQSQRML